jgi:hypothetical protein
MYSTWFRIVIIGNEGNFVADPDSDRINALTRNVAVDVANPFPPNIMVQAHVHGNWGAILRLDLHAVRMDGVLR